MRNTNEKLRYMVRLAVLTAIIVLMGFTPIGYLKIGAVEMTFIVIPVVVGAVILGPAGGAFLGGVFGVTSFIQCFGMSYFGTTLFGINPIFTFILCMVPRVLMGWLAGLIFKALRKTGLVAYIVGCLSGALLNTLFFVGGLILLFGNSAFISEMRGGLNIFAFFVAFVGLNGSIEAVTCAVLGAAISKALSVALHKKPVEGN